MKILFTKVLLFYICMLFFYACSENQSPLEDHELTVTVESTEVVETWLRLSAMPIKMGVVYTVKRDTHIVFQGDLHKADTLLHDKNLLPNTIYTYSVYAEFDGEKSKVVVTTAQTMDTTTHDFSWEAFEFGEKNSSIFYDVAIISPKDIWAVGKIYTLESYTYDSLGNWIEPYNAAHWDGYEWELKRIPFKGSCSVVDYPAIKSVWAFSEKHIFFTNGGTIAVFDGQNTHLECEMNTLLSGALNKIFALDSSNIYGVGKSGTIIHFDGITWRKIDSKTSINLTDIWGFNEEIWICGWEADGRSILLKIDDNRMNIIWTSSDSNYPHEYRDYLSTLWSDGIAGFYISGNGFFYWHSLINPLYIKKMDVDFGHFIYSLRGLSINDVFIIGENSGIYHWNGKTWRKFTEFYQEGSRLYGVDYKQGCVTAVGYSQGSTYSKKAIVLMSTNSY